MNIQPTFSKILLQSIVNIIAIAAIEEIIRGQISQSMVLLVLLIVGLIINLPIEYWMHGFQRALRKEFACRISGGAFIVFGIFTLIIFRDYLRDHPHEYPRILVLWYIFLWIFIPLEYWIRNLKQAK